MTPISASEIQEVVLKEDDFGHEMRVGGILKNFQAPQSAFIKARLSRLDHGGTYVDPATSKTRQFDYRCRISKGIEGLHNILLAVECKNLNPDLPLVVCGRERTDKEAYHLVIARDDENRHVSIAKVAGKSSLYEPSGFVGKSLLRLKFKDKKLCSDGDSEIYDKWSQALASCRDLAIEFANANSTAEIKGSAFLMPIVVVPNNSLWTASYDNGGSIQDTPKQVDLCDFYVEHKLAANFPFVLTHIHFATLKGLSKMLNEYADGDFYKWDKMFCFSSSKFDLSVSG